MEPDTFKWVSETLTFEVGNGAWTHVISVRPVVTSQWPSTLCQPDLLKTLNRPFSYPTATH